MSFLKVRIGYKAWTLALSDGYVFQFDIYSSKSTGPKSSEYEDFGLGGGVVLNLLSIVETPAKHAIYFENFFTSFYLFCHKKKCFQCYRYNSRKTHTNGVDEFVFERKRGIITIFSMKRRTS